MRLNNSKLINKLNELADKYSHLRITKKDLRPYLVNNYSSTSTLVLKNFNIRFDKNLNERLNYPNNDIFCFSDEFMSSFINKIERELIHLSNDIDFLFKATDEFEKVILTNGVLYVYKSYNSAISDNHLYIMFTNNKYIVTKMMPKNKYWSYFSQTIYDNNIELDKQLLIQELTNIINPRFTHKTNQSNETETT